MKLKHYNPIVSMIDSSLMSLPSPASLSYMWNFGSLLGVCLSLQVLTGVLLAMHYSCDTSLAFESVSHIMRDVNWGWMARMIHANGASFFFFFLYIHIGRGLYFGSYNLYMVWVSGVTLLLLVMATAFLGYVLPWGQMSFWGATVITNLFSAIPFLGDSIVMWLWGGFSVGNATLTRFFALHFLLPFIIMFFSAVHLIFLHETGSSNPLGLNSNLDKVPFHPYFSVKDLLGMVFFVGVGLGLCLQAPWALGDPENFIPANPLVTPVHIQPEWYFLFAYAILRSIPNKLGGVLALLLSVLVLYIMPFYGSKSFKSISFYPISKIGFWVQVNIFLLLTWIGARPVEAPYVVTGQVLTVLYFMYFLVVNQLSQLEDKVFYL